MLMFHFASSAIFDPQKGNQSVFNVMRHTIQTIKYEKLTLK